MNPHVGADPCVGPGADTRVRPYTNGPSLLATCAFTAFMAGIVSAQTRLPSVPPKQFGASVTPSYDGWFFNADGSQTFLVGYFNRNTEQEVDIPIGPNNHFEPGEADLGQPTHFLTRRRYGMFVVPIPKSFGKSDQLWWSLTFNGVTNKIPMHTKAEYTVSPFTSTEESPGGGHNTPPVLRFEERGTSFQGPATTFAKAIARTATAGTPMPLTLFADDDALYSTGANGPMNNPAPPVNVTISKYRGPGKVTVADVRPKFEAIKGGKAMEPYTGKSATTVTFSEPGEYLLHVTANDYSGNGGGGSVCCWTNALLKVTVTGGTAASR
jgi:hypothetical protein